MNSTVKSHNKRNNRALTAEWSTPLPLFNSLNDEFHFTLDACAQPFNTKCTRFFTPQKDGLSQSWEGERVFCCPPSGTRELRLWTKKALEEAQKKDTLVVMLLPVSTDSNWFQENIYHQPGVTIRFLPERVKFVNPVVPSWVDGNDAADGKKSCGSMRPSMVVIFTGSKQRFSVE